MTLHMLELGQNSSDQRAEASKLKAKRAGEKKGVAGELGARKDSASSHVAEDTKGKPKYCARPGGEHCVYLAYFLVFPAILHEAF